MTVRDDEISEAVAHGLPVATMADRTSAGQGIELALSTIADLWCFELNAAKQALNECHEIVGWRNPHNRLSFRSAPTHVGR